MKSFQSSEASKIVNNCTVEMDFDFEVNNIVDSLPCYATAATRFIC